MHKRREAEEAEMEGLRCGCCIWLHVNLTVEKKEKKNLKEKEKRRGDVV
ncbi:MAG: hypothetical protein J7L30_02405 [Methanophagales archaeon]|nr:hypothetical protein [Methanophagales archaeon]